MLLTSLERTASLSFLASSATTCNLSLGVNHHMLAVLLCVVMLSRLYLCLYISVVNKFYTPSLPSVLQYVMEVVSLGRKHQINPIPQQLT